MKKKNNKKNQKELKIPSREEQVKKYQNIAPSQLFYNPNTIKWFKKKYNENLIKKSIYSLFPNNCQPIMKEEEWTLPRKLREFVTHYLAPEDKYKHIWINPKYFFSKEVYESILKLKEIFLQFDEDGSRKMEIDEMTTMFNTNNINVTEEELCDLFFKGKKYKKADINKLYLDFFQFMNFALSKKSDQDFRIFMRKIKEKKMKEKEKERLAEEEKRKKNLEYPEEEEEPVDDLFVDEKKEPVFFPMNFNLLLDYFINKGKERKSQKIIRKAIKMMRNILTPGRYPDNDPDFQKDEEDGEEDDKAKEEENKEKKEDEYDKQLREINTMEIMDEFDKLFKMSYISPSSSLKEQTKTKVITSKIAEDTKNVDFTRKQLFRKNTLLKPFQKSNKLEITERDYNSKNDLNKINESDTKEKKEFGLNSREIQRAERRTNTYKLPLEMNLLKNNLIGYKEKNEENEKEKIINKSEKKRFMFFSDLIKKGLEEPNVDDMNLYYFNRLHSVSLAKKATEKKVIDYFNTHQDKKIKSKKNKNNLPVIKDKNQIKININEDIDNKKSVSVRKSEYSKLIDSFGFRRRKYKTKFLY